MANQPTSVSQEAILLTTIGTAIKILAMHPDHKPYLDECKLFLQKLQSRTNAIVDNNNPDNDEITQTLTTKSM